MAGSLAESTHNLFDHPRRGHFLSPPSSRSTMLFVNVRGGSIQPAENLTELQRHGKSTRWVAITEDLAALPPGVLKQVARHIRRGTNYVPKA